MKDGARKIIAIGLGVCFFALLFSFLLFTTKPYTEKIIIWLPDNYELENTVSDGVISIMSRLDASQQSNEVFYTMVDLDSLKKLAGESDRVLSVRIEDASHPGDEKYRILYQIKYHVDNNNKSLVVMAQEYYDYRRTIFSEMRLRDGALFLKYKRDTTTILILSILGFVVVASGVCLYVFYIRDLGICSKKSND